MLLPSIPAATVPSAAVDSAPIGLQSAADPVVHCWLCLLLPAASTQDRVRICRSVSQECRQLVDSQVHSLRANLKSLSTHDDSLALPLRFPRLESLSFDRAAASESSRLLHQLATHQPQLLATLRELDLSSCQVSSCAALPKEGWGMEG